MYKKNTGSAAAAAPASATSSQSQQQLWSPDPAKATTLEMKLWAELLRVLSTHPIFHDIIVLVWQFARERLIEGKWAQTIAMPASYIAAGADHAFVLQRLMQRVQVVSKDGTLIRSISSPLLKRDGMHGLCGLVADATFIFVSTRNQIHKFRHNGAHALSFGSPDQCRDLFGMALDGNELFVADSDRGRVLIFDGHSGLFKREFGQKGEEPNQLNNPNAVAVNASTVFVADGCDRLLMFGRDDGKVLQSISINTLCYGMIGWGGGLIMSCNGDGAIKILDPTTGTVQRSVGQEGEGNGPAVLHFSSPGGIAIVADRLWVADIGNNRIQVLT